MLIRDVLKWGHETLLLSSESARLDAELLLSHVLKKPVTFLLAHDDNDIGFFSLWKYKRMITKRKKGIPVAYLTGHKEFFFLDFEVSKNVLVPRPDTEILVEAVIEYIHSLPIKITEGEDHDPRRRDWRIAPSVILLDIGTGSGCIPIAVCKNMKGLEAVATDISSAALRVAKRNVKKHKLTSRITLVLSDLLKNVPSELFEDREIIVTANLPYIPFGFSVSPDVACEPSISLYGGEDGMDVYKRLTDQVRTLRPRALFFELFEHQIAILKTRLPDYRLKYVKDMSGEARVLCMEKED